MALSSAVVHAEAPRTDMVTTRRRHGAGLREYAAKLETCLALVVETPRSSSPPFGRHALVPDTLRALPELLPSGEQHRRGK